MINKIKNINATRPYIAKLLILLLLISIILFSISYFGYYTINSSYYGFKNTYKFGYCAEVRDHGLRLCADFPEINTKRVYFFKDGLLYEAAENAVNRYAEKYPHLVTADDRNADGTINYKKFVENHKNDPVFRDMFINHLYLVKYKESDLENIKTFITNLYHYITESEKRIIIDRKYKISSATLFYQLITNDKDLLCDHLFEYYLSK